MGWWSETEDLLHAAAPSPYHCRVSTGTAMHPCKQVILFGVLVGQACAVGCPRSSGKGTVSGEGYYLGNPPKERRIRFVPKDGSTQPADAPIKDGRYTATVPAGEMRVEISAPKVMGKIKMMPDSPEVDQVGELIPERYNVKTELFLTVQSGS